MVDFDALLAEVWQLRAEIADRWPTPKHYLDAARFTAQEGYEFMDACELRNGDYVRNHDKDAVPEKELAQVVVMALTAWGLIGSTYRKIGLVWRNASSPDHLALAAASVHESGLAGFNAPKVVAITVLLGQCEDMADVLCIDLSTIVRAELARIRAKYTGDNPA